MGVRDNIRKHIDRLGYKGNLTRFSKEAGISNSYLNEILSGKRRFNEDWLNKVSKALGVQPYELLSDTPLIPFESREPILKFNMPEGEVEGIKTFENPACLGPGYHMDELVPVGYMPILKKDLPVGYKSERDRIVCFPTEGVSMVPTIYPGSYVWIDRYVPAEHVEEGTIYAFLLPDDSITIKRLIKKTNHSIIIDADNQDPHERKEGSVKDFPMILNLREDHSIIRGRVIWILNRLIEMPKEKKAE